MVPLTEAQDSLECHVQWDTIETSYYDIPQSLNQSTTPIYVKVYFTIVREDDGTGGYNPNDIDDLKTIMDNEFNEHDIYFQYECEPDYLDNSERLTNGLHSKDEYYCPWESIPKKQDGLQIFVLNEVSQNAANWTARGIAGDIPSIWMVVGTTGSYPIRETTLIHEIGHCLGLLHTFHGWTKNSEIYCDPAPVPLPFSEAAINCSSGPPLVDENECAELVDGSNGKICGDYVKDTPASTIKHETYAVDDNNCTDNGLDVYNAYEQDQKHSCELILDPDGQDYQPDYKNYMALTKFKSCREHFSDGQVGVMRHMLNTHPDLQPVVRTETEVANTCPCPSGVLEITDNPVVINSDMELADDIIVRTGAHLTITSTIEFNQDNGIIVERGAKLVINDATLTKCPNADYWKGIFVEGNANIAQPAYSAMPASDESGIVLILNNSLIEHAQTAISTIKKGQGWNDDYWGGVVYCNEANFVNNRRGVAFMKYGYPGHYKNESAFIQCEFIIDGNYSYPYASTTHGITIWNCNDIEIKSTDFINLHTGLAGIDFSAKVISGNKFKDCRYGIKSNSSNNFASALKLGKSDAIENIFEDNARSIWLQANDYLNGGEIENNEFKITSTYSFPSQKHNGLYIEGLSYFVVNENTFTDYFSPAIISHTGDDHNDFKCNSILNDKDLNAEGLVIRNKNDYLEFLSNTFTIPFECKPDVRIYGSEYEGTVKEDQGGGSRPAGNCFSKQDRLEIEAIYNTRPFDYYVEQEFVDYCLLPTDNQYDGGVNNYDLEFTRLLYPNCDAQTDPGGEITTTSTNVTLDGGGENSGDGDYDTLRYQINSEWEAGNYQNAIQILLNDGSPHSLRIAFGMYIKLGDYVSADSLLNVILSNNAMDDTPEFYAVQTINLRRLNAIGDTTGFELTQTEYDTLYTIAQGETYSATYAKSLLDFLEEVIIDFIPNPDCVEEDDEGQAGLRESSGIKNTESISIKLWPTPANDVINYKTMNLGDRILQSVQLISSKGQSFSMNGIGESTQIDIAKFPSGIYIFEFQFDDGTKASKRFIKL